MRFIKRLHCANNPLAFIDPAGLDIYDLTEALWAGKYNSVPSEPTSYANLMKIDHPEPVTKSPQQEHVKYDLAKTASETFYWEARAGAIGVLDLSIPGKFTAKAMIDLGSQGLKYENGETTSNARQKIELALAFGQESSAAAFGKIQVERTIESPIATAFDMICNTTGEPIVWKEPTAETGFEIGKFRMTTDNSSNARLYISKTNKMLEFGLGLGIYLKAGINLDKLRELKYQIQATVVNSILPENEIFP